MAIMFLRKIEVILARDRIQRLTYFLMLIMWTLMMWDRIITDSYAASSIGLNYVSLFSLPAVLLALQVIMNNKPLWVLIFSLVTIYILTALYLVISDAIERSGNHVKAIAWEPKNILMLLLTFSILFVADWTIYKLKPTRLI